MPNDSPALSAAASASGGELWLPSGQSFTIGSNLTLNCDLRFIGGTTFTVQTGITLTLNGRVSAPLEQCFILQGTGAISLGDANNIVPAEWFGAVGDWNGTTGTDNTTAFNNCLASITVGQMQLQGKHYKVTGAININKPCVGIVGATTGFPLNISGSYYQANTPNSGIVSTSASANVITMAGISTAGLLYNRLEYFDVSRTATPTGTAAGISVSYAGGFIIRHVTSLDSIYGFYINGVGAVGQGIIERCLASWGDSPWSPSAPATNYGYYITSPAGNPGNASMKMSYCLSNPATYGVYLTGPQVSDTFIDHLETAGCGYGVYVDATGINTAINASADIHITDFIIDSVVTEGITINGLTAATGGSCEITGGWINGFASGSNYGIHIQNSSGVIVKSVIMYNDGNMAYGTYVTGSSSVSLSGNYIFGFATAGVYMSSCTTSTITANTFNAVSARPTTTFVSFVGTTRSGVIGNTIDGHGTTGISFDATSNNNYILGSGMINPTNITTPTSNSGSGNVIT